MTATTSSIFSAAIILAMISWVFGVVETIATWRFVPWAFAFGIRPIRRHIVQWTRPPAFEALEIDSASPVVRVRMLASGELLFRNHIPLVGGVHTLTPFKGTVRWDQGRAVLEIRILSSPIAFGIFWLGGWTIGALAMSGKSPGGALAFWSLGAAMLGGMFAWSAWLERRRLQHALDQLADRMTWPRVLLADKSLA